MHAVFPPQLGHIRTGLGSGTLLYQGIEPSQSGLGSPPRERMYFLFCLSAGVHRPQAARLAVFQTSQGGVRELLLKQEVRCLQPQGKGGPGVGRGEQICRPRGTATQQGTGSCSLSSAVSRRYSP